MSEALKTIRIIDFKDDRDEFRMWSKKFLSLAGLRKYRNVLMGETEVPKHDLVLDETDAVQKKLIEARKANNNAYNDLVLACSGDIGFAIVDEATSEDLPDGDARLAWINLEKKFQPSTSANKVQLRKEFNASKLNSWSQDPDEWITKLEIKRKRLIKMGTEINDEDLMIHILNNLPSEYDNVAEAMERRLDDVIKPLEIGELRDELVMKFNRIKKNKGLNGDTNSDEVEESALAAFSSRNFKGRCYNCGEFGHKKQDCPQLKNNNGKNTFNGNCFYCGKRGHKKSECRRYKKKLLEEAAANLVREQEDDEVVLIGMENLNCNCCRNVESQVVTEEVIEIEVETTDNLGEEPEAESDEVEIETPPSEEKERERSPIEVKLDEIIAKMNYLQECVNVIDEKCNQTFEEVDQMSSRVEYIHQDVITRMERDDAFPGDIEPDDRIELAQFTVEELEVPTYDYEDTPGFRQEEFDEAYRWDLDDLDVEIEQELQAREYRRDLSSINLTWDDRGEPVFTDLRTGRVIANNATETEEAGLIVSDSDMSFNNVESRSNVDKNLWIADSGASSHMTNDLTGMTDLKDYSSNIKVGSGKILKATKIGRFVGSVKQKDGSEKRIVLSNVKYVPEIFCKLISLTQVMNNGFEMNGKKQEITIRKGKHHYCFDNVIRSGKGILLGMEIQAERDLKLKNMKKFSIQSMHDRLGHPGARVTIATSMKLGLQLNGVLEECEHCAQGKLRQKNLTKVSPNKADKAGGRIYIDGSSIKASSGGGSKFWFLFVDEFTGFKQSVFLSKKSDFPKAAMLVMRQMIKKGIDVKKIRCDNAGENKKLEEKIIESELKIDFEYTPVGTPQHNGVVERAFATLYGRVRAMFNRAGIHDENRKILWAECASGATFLDGILVENSKDKCRHEKFYGTMPSFSKNLRVFGEMGVVLDQQNRKIKQKLSNRGKTHIFVGYSSRHSSDVYRMYNLETKRVTVTRDIRWLGMTYGKYMSKEENLPDEQPACDDSDEDEDVKTENFFEISEAEPVVYEKPVTRSMSAQRTEEKNDTEDNSRLTGELRRLHTSWNPVLNEVVDFAMVGGTDDLHENPTYFNEAWNHEDPQERKHWRDAIKKEFRDMIKNEVWSKYKKKDIPNDRRLLGSKWVFKKKKNGVFRARLVALGYNQIPGVDHQDNFAPVVTETTFRLVMIFSMLNDCACEIVDIETAFLYGDLEETIFMKVPEGLSLVTGEVFDEDQALILKHSIYGLVQAARQFFKKLRNVLTQRMGFRKCLNDQCLLMRDNEKGMIIVCLYIDDTLVIGKKKDISFFKKELKNYFSTKEEGEMTEFVGCMVKRDGDDVYFHQSDLILKIERTFSDELKNVKRSELPANPGEGIVAEKDESACMKESEQTKYRSGVGMLLFLVKYSRPDISNAVRELSKGNKNPNPAQYKKLLKTIKYVVDTKERALKYQGHEYDEKKDMWNLKTYCDSDFAGDSDGRVSVTGFCVYVFGKLVSWKSHAQKNVTLSSTEAEYVAMAELCGEILFVKSILEFLGVKLEWPILVNCDNIGAIYLAHNAKTSQRTKHIDVKYHFVREYVENGLIKIVFVKSEENDADIWTKNVKSEIFRKHTEKFMSSVPQQK